jgi:succinyl-diaminopimelate desuccinylase
LLGYPTINVGKISGGMNINSVPDHAEFTIDIRTTTKVDHDKILERIAREIGIEGDIETLVNLESVFTPENDPFAELVYDVCGIGKQSAGFPLALPFMTDGAVLQKFYNNAPLVILGPGEPGMAHQTDEFCPTDKLERAVNIYMNLISKWSLKHD